MEPNRYDVSTKELILDGPAAWAERFSIGPPGPVEVIESQITALTAAADKVLKVGSDPPYLIDLEPHAYHDMELARTLWFRQVALDYRHNLPVLTVLILLRKQANSPGLRGTYQRHLPDGWLTNRYHYRVLRLWKEDPEDYLNAGISLVPLAPLTDVPKAELPGVVDRMSDRINAEPRPCAAKLWLATNTLMGLRYPDELVGHLLEGKGVEVMQESTTYQKIVREAQHEGEQKGRQEEARRLLLRHGTKRFGEPDAAVVATLETIKDIDRLESLTDCIIDATASDWNDLLRGS